MNIENQNVEYKESWRDEYLKWICGFANAQGGKICVGVDDEGFVVGLDEKEAHRLSEEIPNKVQNVLGIIVDVDLKEKDGKCYVEIGVEPQYCRCVLQVGFHRVVGTWVQENPRRIRKGRNETSCIRTPLRRSFGDHFQRENGN